ncbi:MAG: MASE3 domain-containing protein, partial [Fervidobacterium sp.]
MSSNLSLGGCFFNSNVGVIYLFTSIVDYVHTLAYKGMNIFTVWTANQPT